MTNIIKQDEIFTYIKSIILKYCPNVDDRLEILDGIIQTQFNICIKYMGDKTKIMFLKGNRNFKQSIPEMACLDSILDINNIKTIIDFILQDHEVFKNIDISNNKISFVFAINWNDNSIKGLKCDDIKLELEFDNFELKKQYLYFLLKTYYELLKDTPSFKDIKDEYILKLKKEFLSGVLKDQLTIFLGQLNLEELKTLVLRMDNDIFINHRYHNGKQILLNDKNF